ncbi:MAG TPA: helix-turn-helix transcriptional regulator [Allosphingosinicella sp.]|nr:helix-turn-helix transcriptional regulator [Allosphingosinicella sp.]
MTRPRALSGHARALLAALLAAGPRWSYGYELASLTGIKSGTLYPLLIRLEGQSYLEAEWQQPVAAGRPPRHAYRLTAAGRRLALAEAAAVDRNVAIAGGRAGEAAS